MPKYIHTICIKRRITMTEQDLLELEQLAEMGIS